MLSTALVICQDVSSVVYSDNGHTTEEYELDQLIISGIQNLCQVGLKTFILAIISTQAEVEKRLSRCIQNSIPNASILFIRIRDTSIGTGDILIESRHLLQDNEPILVVSWRSIPDADTLMTFLNNPVQLASILATGATLSQSDTTIAIDSTTNCLLETDTPRIPSSVEYKSLKGLYCVTPSLLDMLPSSYPVTRPTSLIQVLHQANQLSPNRIQVFSENEPVEFRTVYLRLLNHPPLENKSISLFIENGMDNTLVASDDLSETFKCRCRVHSVLRYCYGVCDNLYNIHYQECRSIPREIRISPGIEDLYIRDQTENPLQRRMILRQGIRVILSLEKWRWNHSYLIKQAVVPQIVSLCSGSVVLDMPTNQWSDVTLALQNENTGEIEMITIFAMELQRILTEPSINHNDGQIVKQLKNGTVIEFHGLIVTPIASNMDNQMVHGYGLHYHPSLRPISIGHRGCGMNTIPNQSEIENSLHSFTEAARRGLSTVEFDLQLSLDLHVMVFHDYIICLKDKQIPIADSPSDTLRRLPLPSPIDYHGEIQYMPFFREMIHCLPPWLQFNIEIKYPMPSELVSAKLRITKEEYVDTIVRELQSMYSTRVIYISSFDVDICLMLLHKQVMYPVFLLLDDVSNCIEISKKEWLERSWKQYVESALERGQFRGVVAAAELINEESVKWLKQHNLVVYTWGKENNEEKERTYQTEIGVDGIIADKFD